MKHYLSAAAQPSRIAGNMRNEWDSSSIMSLDGFKRQLGFFYEKKGGLQMRGQNKEVCLRET